MVTRTLTLQSDPTGIEIKVQHGSVSYWRVTNTSIVVDDGTVITLIAPSVVGEPVATPELGWYFKEWKSNGTLLGSERAVQITMDADKTAKAYFEIQEYFPTRRPTRRTDKFEGKIDSEVMASRTTALKSMMVDQQRSTTAEQTRIETLVGSALETEALYGSQLHHYRNFSQELYGLSKLFRSATLNKEASLKAEKWRTRLVADGQADADVKTRLQKVANIFNITLTFT